MSKQIQQQKYTKADSFEFNREGGTEFASTSALLSCDNRLIKTLVSDGAKIESSKRIRTKYRGLSDAPRRDIIYMGIPLSKRKPSIPGLRFGYVVYVHASIKKISRAKATVNLSVIDNDTKRFLLFGTEYELSVPLNDKWEVDIENVDVLMSHLDDSFEKLDRFLISLDNDLPEKKQIKPLNRELIGAMLRTARRTTEVINIDSFNNEEALKVTPSLERFNWTKRRSKLQLWRIAFNNVFDIDHVNSIGIQYRLNNNVSTMTRKYKTGDSISSTSEIPILELITRSLISTLVSHGNFEDVTIPVKFDIKNFI